MKGHREISFDGRTLIDSTVYERDGLDIGTQVSGPCVVEQFDATTVVPPGWTARVDKHRNLILETGA